MKLREYNRLRRKIARATGRKLPAVRLPHGMNQNERRFRRMILNGAGSYEPIKIAVTEVNQRHYTPDFVYATGDLKVAIVEVKGSYKLQSEERARLAWEIAAEKDITRSVFVWARYNRSAYDCEAWFDNGHRIVTRRCHTNDDFEQLLKGDGHVR